MIKLIQLRQRNELLCLKMKGLDKTTLWLQGSPASKGGFCTKEEGVKPVPTNSCKDLICYPRKPKTPKPWTDQKAASEAAAAICLPAPRLCGEGSASASNVAMRNHQQKLFEIIKSHWSQQAEQRPSMQIEEDFEYLRQWQKIQSTSWIGTRLQQALEKGKKEQKMPQTKVQQEYEQKQQQQQDIHIKCEAKQKDLLSAECRATTKRPKLMEEGRDAPQETQGVFWPGISCQELKDIDICLAYAKQAVEQQNANESRPIAAEKKEHQETPTGDVCKDTANQREQTLEEEAPQGGVIEKLELREVKRMSKCLNLLELEILLQKGGYDNDSDGFVLQQIEEISKLCAILKEKYERRQEKRTETETKNKDEVPDRSRKDEAEVEADLQRKSLISDLKQKQKDILSKQQLLQRKYMKRLLEENSNESINRRLERKLTMAVHKERLKKTNRMVKQVRVSILPGPNTHRLVITPAISKWKKIKAEPRGLEDAFSDPFV